MIDNIKIIDIVALVLVWEIESENPQMTRKQKLSTERWLWFLFDNCKLKLAFLLIIINLCNIKRKPIQQLHSFKKYAISANNLEKYLRYFAFFC